MEQPKIERESLLTQFQQVQNEFEESQSQDEFWSTDECKALLQKMSDIYSMALSEDSRNQKEIFDQMHSLVSKNVSNFQSIIEQNSSNEKFECWNVIYKVQIDAINQLIRNLS